MLDLTNTINLRIQIVCYICAVSIFSVFPLNEILFIFVFFFISASIFLKIYRQIRLQHRQELLRSQVSFYIPYLLTIFQIIFSNQGTKQLTDLKHFDIFNNTCLALLTINSSFICHKKLISLPEIVAYSIGIILGICNQVSLTIELIIFFDTQFQDDLQKDFLLLTTSTGIAVGGIILDIFLRNYQKMKDEQDQVI